MNKLRGCAIITLAAASLLAGRVAADETPPRDLHLVGDHWTAWQPPTDFPDGATVYTIVRGDTLWDLASRFYGDPYLWPQLWEQNRYILDAHWIYPGDPLLVDVEVTSADEYAESARAGEGPGGPGEGAPGEDDPFRGVITADQAAGAPVPLGAEADIYCSGFIGDLEQDFPYQMVGSEYGALTPSLSGPRDQHRNSIYEYRRDTVRYDLSTGDVVYLGSGTASGLQAGQILSVVSARDRVFHPRDRSTVVGRYYAYLGRVRVLSVQQDTSMAEILNSCGPIRVGDYLRPFEQQPVPLGRRTRMRPINLPASAQDLEGAPIILRSNDRVISMGQGTLVYIDRGEDDDVLPGDLFTIYRLNKPGLPPVVLGELAILSSEDHTALARILESRYVVYAGDRVERK
ncbi:MAG: LysM peptidoglycan-binding domain-containing protein [Gemmatimonadota bacterium]|jgi:hypothetical protein